MLDKENPEFAKFSEIPLYYEFKDVCKIDSGFSKDTKYHVELNDGQTCLLRITQYETFNNKLRQFEHLSKIKSKHARFPKALAFGLLSNNRVYTLFTYIEGEDLSNRILDFSPKEQYALGEKAGLFLKDLHKLRKKKDKDYYTKYCNRLDEKIKVFNELQIDLPNKDLVVNYLLKTKELIKNRNITLNHGDYHIGNMVINSDNELGIIDFDKTGFKETYDDFKPFYWSASVSPMFASGLINAYFKNKVSDDFFKVLAHYACQSLISHLPWSLSFGEKEIEIAKKAYTDILDYYDNFNLIIPKWYVKPSEVK